MSHFLMHSHTALNSGVSIISGVASGISRRSVIFAPLSFSVVLAVDEPLAVRARDINACLLVLGTEVVAVWAMVCVDVVDTDHVVRPRLRAEDADRPCARGEAVHLICHLLPPIR